MRLSLRTILPTLLLCLAAAAPSPGASYLCFGDSITYGENGSDSAGYLGHLGAYLSANQAPAEMINRGVGGENTAQGLARLRSLVRSRPTDYVLIMEGTNDITQWLNDPTFTAAHSQANIREMVRAVKAAGEIPILATVAPRNGNNADPGNGLTRQLNSRIRAVAAAEGVALAEVYGHIESRFSGVLYEDTLHPNQWGHAMVAEAFASAILGRPVGEIDLTPPLPLTIQPIFNSRTVPIDANVRIGVSEDKHPVDPLTAVMKIDGQTVTPVVDTTSISGQTLFVYDPPQLLGFGRTVTVSFTLADSNLPPNELNLQYTFRTTAGNGTNGDIDRSGRIDGIDLALLAASFGVNFRDSRYRAAADIDANGVVDGFDLMLLTSRFGGAP